MALQARIKSVRDSLTAAAVLVAYAPLALLLTRAPYGLLNNELRGRFRSQLGVWPDVLTQEFNPFALDFPVYRPLPEMLEWLFSQHSPAVWHAVNLLLRVAGVFLMALLLRTLDLSAVARQFGTLFFAFFPAFPEGSLPYSETVLVPMLLVTLNALAAMYVRETVPKWVPYAGIGSLVMVTMCKEILAPVSLVLFLAYAWRMRAGSRGMTFLLLPAALAAVLLQASRAAAMALTPYAQGGTARSVQGVVGAAKWVVVNSTLWTTNLKIVSVIIMLLVVAGIGGLVQRSTPRSTAGFFTLLAIALMIAAGIAVMTPYFALRYLSPVVVFLAPLAAFGADVVTRMIPAAAFVVSGVSVAIVIFGAFVLLAEAFSLASSAQADDAMLRYIAGERRSGRDVVLFHFDRDDERLLFLRAELARLSGGRGGRVISVGESSMQLASKADPATVILPERQIAVLRARETYLSDAGNWRAAVRKPVVVALAPAAGADVCAATGLVRDNDFSFGAQSPWYGPLVTFERIGRTLNRSFSYPYGGGLQAFPGGSWRTCTL